MVSSHRFQRWTCAVAIALLAAPAAGAGFGIFQQGAKAMGMAGAFTAQADDPSALFHNVGGLAFQNERSFQAGVTFISVTPSDFTGTAPGLAIGVVSESEPLFKVPVHFYWVEPLGDRVSFGLSVNSPFGLTSEWAEPDFPGRFISKKASLVSYDLSPSLAWKASETLGVGIGAVVRFSEVELIQDLPTFDPAAGQVVAAGELAMNSDLESGVGFQAGMNGRPNSSWSWGLSYRSPIEIDYAGSGRIRHFATGNAALDALLLATIPFDQDLPLVTRIEFPDMLSAGVAVRPSREWLVELDVNWTGWSSLSEYDIRFPQNPVFDRRLPQDWVDVYNYRLGASRASGRGSVWRLGVSFDETPQPLTTLDPILPDGDQSALTLGYGFERGRATVDLALMFVEIARRTTTVNINGFNGTYESTGLLFASSVAW